MQKIAIVVLSDTVSDEALGRIFNALTAAKEYKEAGDEVNVTFTGTGTNGSPRWTRLTIPRTASIRP